MRDFNQVLTGFQGRAYANLAVRLLVGLLPLLVLGCSNDFVLDLDRSNSVRLVGHGDNFDCEDPAFAGVRRVKTFTLVFADGTVKELCKEDASGSGSPPKSGYSVKP